MNRKVWLGILWSFASLLATGNGHSQELWGPENIRKFLGEIRAQPTDASTSTARATQTFSMLRFLASSSRAQAPFRPGSFSAEKRAAGLQSLFDAQRFDTVSSPQVLGELHRQRDFLTLLVGSHLLQSKKPPFIIATLLPEGDYRRYLEVLRRDPPKDVPGLERRGLLLDAMAQSGLLEQLRFDSVAARIDTLIGRKDGITGASPLEVHGVVLDLASCLGFGSFASWPPASLALFPLLALLATVAFFRRKPPVAGGARPRPTGVSPPRYGGGLTPPPVDLAGFRAALADRYDGLEELGRGGMGVVFRARDTRLKRDVAIKALNVPLEGGESFIARFQREAEIMARLDHPAIIRVFDVASEPTPHMVMELLPGEGFDGYLAEAGPLPIDEVTDLLGQLLEALRHAHERGVVHRDLKPSNIHRAPDGRIKVLDFGIAKTRGPESKLTQTGSILGSPQYMAPEQLRGREAGPAADIYALGVLGYEMLTGHLPYDDEAVFAKVFEPPTPPRDYRSELPEALEKVLLNALESDEEKRYQDTFAFEQALLEATKND